MSEVSRKDEIQGEIIHEYDGIEEADNDLPYWWLVTFYGAVVFAVVYWFGLHEFDMWPSIQEEYAAAVAAHLERFPPVTPEELEALEGDTEAAEAGAALFAANCVACHKEQGQGDIGPNLTDRYWIHGGSVHDIYRVVSEGALEKGMPNWLSVLGPTGSKQVTAYVLTLRNTDVEGKDPEGEPWPAEEEVTVDAGTDAAGSEAAEGEEAEAPGGVDEALD